MEAETKIRTSISLLSRQTKAIKTPVEDALTEHSLGLDELIRSARESGKSDFYDGLKDLSKINIPGVGRFKNFEKMTIEIDGTKREVLAVCVLLALRAVKNNQKKILKARAIGQSFGRRIISLTKSD